MREKIEKLAAEILVHNDKYYGEDNPLISDADYDKLVLE
ncbi:MAG: hypothetical protein JJV90_01195, partial [Spiroplasma sp.]|nr:hypothetical protein [Mycoplasmatales bacterium]